MLPENLKTRLTAELYKRLDVNLDEFFLSPKLRLKLSPAELDKALLELYDNISESPTGDVLRVIGGGGQIGLQNWYLQNESRKRKPNRPLNLEDRYELRGDEAASKWVRKALNRNIRDKTSVETTGSGEKDPTAPRMCLARPSSSIRPPVLLAQHTLTQSSFCTRTKTLKLLI